MVLTTFYNGIWGFCASAHAGAHGPCLAKPLKCCNFGVCSLIELKFLMNGPYNFYHGIWGYCMHVLAGEHAPCLAWLAKPLKFCNFSVCSLIELKISVIGPYNFLQWNLRFLCAPVHTRVLNHQSISFLCHFCLRQLCKHSFCDQ